MQYRNGVKVCFHSNANSALSQRKLLICGTKGTIDGDLIEGKITLKTISGRRSTREVLEMKGIFKLTGASSSSASLPFLPLFFAFSFLLHFVYYFRQRHAWWWR